MSPRPGNVYTRAHARISIMRLNSVSCFQTCGFVPPRRNSFISFKYAYVIRFEISVATRAHIIIISIKWYRNKILVISVRGLDGLRYLAITIPLYNNNTTEWYHGSVRPNRTRTERQTHVGTIHAMFPYPTTDGTSSIIILLFVVSRISRFAMCLNENTIEQWLVSYFHWS